MEAQEKLWRDGEHLSGDSVKQILDNFFQHCKRHTLRTQQHYKFVLSRFVEGLPCNILQVHQIESSHIQEYLYRLRDNDCINRTLNANLTAIKSFCKFFSEKHNIPNPAAKVCLLKEDPPQSRFLEESEYQALLKLAPVTAYNRLVFLANTGLRASEFASLKPANLNSTATAITIVGKGRKQRTIPLNDTARSILPELKIGTPNALWLSFSRLAEKADIPKCGPHSVRHYFATQLLLKGVPVIVVSRLLGHSSVRTTERIYAHILIADLANATKVLDNSS